MNLAKKLTEDISYLFKMDELSARRKIVFRNGQRKVKMVCGPGYKLVHGICQRMKASEVLSRRRGARRALRLRRSHQSQTNRKRALTLRRRHSAGF